MSRQERRSESLRFFRNWKKREKKEMTEEHFLISIGLMMVSFIWAVFAFDNILDTAGKKFDIGSFVISIL